MNKGICPICHKDFRVTKLNKMRRHGYKYKRKEKTWNGLFEYKKIYMIMISPPCTGSKKRAEKIIKVENK